MALESAVTATIRGRDAELAQLGVLLDRVRAPSGAPGRGSRRDGEESSDHGLDEDTHLRQVFAKLEVSSRVELARLATERTAELAH
jgi:hypothetical protein